MSAPLTVEQALENVIASNGQRTHVDALIATVERKVRAEEQAQRAALVTALRALIPFALNSNVRPAECVAAVNAARAALAGEPR